MDDLVSRLLEIEREKREILQKMRERELVRAKTDGLIEHIKPQASPRMKKQIDDQLARLLRG